jgi:hypothetical protein
VLAASGHTCAGQEFLAKRTTCLVLVVLKTVNSANSAVVGPMDQIVAYLAAGLGVGQRLKLDTIDRRLRRLPLRQSLMILSQICFKVDKAALPPMAVDAQIEIANQIFPREFLPAALGRLRQPYPRVMVMSPQVIVLLGIRLLAVSADNVGDVADHDRLGKELGALLLALADHVDAGPLTVETTVLDLLRLSLFYERSGHSGWLSLAGRLFFEVLPRLVDDPAWVDPLAVFQASAGLTLERFWAITAAQAILAAHSPEHFLLPTNVQERPIPAVELDAWRRLMVSPLTTAMSAARADMRKPLAWSMTAVWKRPIIDLGGGRGPVLRSSLLQMQAEPSQMFWHVRDVLHEQRVPHLKWSTLYGKAVEVLGIDLLRETLDVNTILNEDAFVKVWSIPSSAKRADVAIIGNHGDLVVIDFVSRQFTQETTTTGDFESLSKDLKLGVAEKLTQIDSTLQHALEAGAGSGRIFPVVVIAGPFPTLPHFHSVINTMMKDQPLSVINKAPQCRPWMVLDLLAFDTLLRVSAEENICVPDLLDQWQNSALARGEFRDWAIREGPARALPNSQLSGDGFRRVSAYLGFGPDGLPIDDVSVL